MNYTKHQVKRIKDLNDKYFEVVFSKDALQYVPGSTVKLYNGPDYPVFIASGIQEPWVRLILNRDLFSLNFKPHTLSIRLSLEIDNKLPTLMNEKKPSFVFDSETIGAFFSWVSTYPEVKCKVCYIGDNKLQENWINANHTTVKMSDVLKMKKENSLYVTGYRDSFEGKSKRLINNCKSSFIIG